MGASGGIERARAHAEQVRCQARIQNAAPDTPEWAVKPAASPLGGGGERYFVAVDLASVGLCD